MLKLFQCVSVHCSQHLHSEYEVGGGSELIYRSQQGGKVQMWNMMMSFGRDHVIKDWQKELKPVFNQFVSISTVVVRMFQCPAWCGGT
jgi:hypothetical protein